MNIDLNSISCIEELEVLVRLQGISMKKFLKRTAHFKTVCKTDAGMLQYVVIGGKLVWFDINTGRQTDSPKRTYQSFICKECITSLEGCPEVVDGNLYCHGLSGLKSFKGGPKTVKGSVDVSNTGIQTFEGCPEHVGGSFYCYNAPIITLKGCPQTVHGDFFISNTKITSLEGCPKLIGGDFNCVNTDITTFAAGPSAVHGYPWIVCTKAPAYEFDTYYQFLMKQMPDEVRLAHIDSTGHYVP